MPPSHTPIPPPAIVLHAHLHLSPPRPTPSSLYHHPIPSPIQQRDPPAQPSRAATSA
ncbi:hypothetical protein K491DRAFT_688437 [Lophiostoma macrostomum CBS 122681]|uniref:Uncharacterized protein n=1 Tax=Lophiostoma macrostomum CBS 122681 TaxID=1314788 RepID=A0A6A6TK48_9PLEO|nr:hypothetical protein K491DRAFT_688437 [Lophiostoma macrostomum CBS 122681]